MTSETGSVTAKDLQAAYEAHASKDQEVIALNEFFDSVRNDIEAYAQEIVEKGFVEHPYHSFKMNAEKCSFCFSPWSLTDKVNFASKKGALIALAKRLDVSLTIEIGPTYEQSNYCAEHKSEVKHSVRIYVFFVPGPTKRFAKSAMPEDMDQTPAQEEKTASPRIQIAAGS